MRDQAVDEGTPALRSNSELKDIQEEISRNQDLIRKTINYVDKNREAIDEVTLGHLNERLNFKNTGKTSDPIQDLQKLSRQELAFAYDTLLTCLEQRATLIENRLKSQINYLGVNERIMFEGKDWSRENEDMKDYLDPFNTNTKVEQFISVSEQVSNVLDYKNTTPEERLYQLLSRSYNPFLEPNFNDNQLQNATSPLLDSNYRIPIDAPDPELAPSINRMLFSGYMFIDDNLERIQSQIEDLKDKFDMPFDELYHKEKKLVDSVINATESLRKKELGLPNAMGVDRTFDINELKNDYFGNELKSEHQFVIDQRNKSKE